MKIKKYINIQTWKKNLIKRRKKIDDELSTTYKIDGIENNLQIKK